MNASSTAALQAPNHNPAAQLLKAAGLAIINSSALTAGITIALAVFLVFSWAHTTEATGDTFDGLRIIGIWLSVIVCSWMLEGISPAFEAWFEKTSNLRAFQIFILPLFVAFVAVAPWFQYDASCKYRVKIGDVVLSEANPSVYAWPFSRVWAPIEHTYTHDVSGTTADGYTLKAKMRVTAHLGDDPTTWPWQSAVHLHQADYSALQPAFERAFQRAIASLSARDINRGSLAIDIDTGTRLELKSVGLGLPATITVTEIVPYIKE